MHYIVEDIEFDFEDSQGTIDIEEQISIILCALENSVKYADSEYIEEVDEIFEVLEKTVDKFYAKIEKAQAKQPSMEWD